MAALVQPRYPRPFELDSIRFGSLCKGSLCISGWHVAKARGNRRISLGLRRPEPDDRMSSVDPQWSFISTQLRPGPRSCPCAPSPESYTLDRDFDAAHPISRFDQRFDQRLAQANVCGHRGKPTPVRMPVAKITDGMPPTGHSAPSAPFDANL